MRRLRVFVSSMNMPQRDWTKDLICNLPVQPPPEFIVWESAGLALGPMHYSELTPQKACLTGVDKSDIILGLLAEKYGDVQESGFSATHEELLHALSKSKRLLIFVDQGATLEPKQEKCLEELKKWHKGRIIFRVPFQDRAAFDSEVRKWLLPVAQELAGGRLIDSLLAESDARIMFAAQSASGSSQCCAFLAGDWSVLVTKRALLVGLDARVRVAISSVAEGSTAVIAYEKSPEGFWTLNERYSVRLSAVVNRVLNWTAFRQRFPWTPKNIEVLAFSDLPFGAAAHEDAGFCLGLGGALAKLGEQQHLALQLGGAVLSQWYPQVSWAPLVRCHVPDPAGKHLLFFDRTGDGGINLKGLATEKSLDFERNAFLPEGSWKADWLNFGLNRITLWLGGPTAIDIDERGQYKQPVQSLHHEFAEGIVSEMRKKAVDGDDRGVGFMMQVHQLMLAAAGFVDQDYQQLISWINGLPGVLGAKSACARGRGAIVLLTARPLDASSATVKEMQDRGLRCAVMLNRPPKGTLIGRGWD